MFNCEVEVVVVGFEGFFFLLYLVGERIFYVDFDVCGCFIGLIFKYGWGYMVWVVMEGVIYVMWDSLEIIYEFNVFVC